MQLKSLKVGYVLKEFPKLSETFILNEILGLERQGLQVKIFSLRDPFSSNPLQVQHDSLKNLASNVFYLPTRMIFRTSCIKKGNYKSGEFSVQTWKDELDGISRENINNLHALMIASIIKSSGIEHLHSHFGTASSVAMLAADMAGIDFSFTTHAKDIYKNDVNYNDLGLKIKKSRFVITVSDYNKKFLIKKFKDSDNKIVRLYNSIDLDKFKIKNKNIKDNIVLAVGRLEKKKGFEYLVESCSTLKNKEVSFKCLVVGEGQERQNLELLIKKYGLSKYVELLGARNQGEIIELLSTSKVFVLPSIIDGSGDRDVLPTVLIEAMAMNVPVVSTNVSAIPEIVENNKSGLLTEQKDPGKLANCIQQLLIDEHLCNKFSNNGRKRVETLFNVKKNIPILAKLFSQSSNNKNNKIAI